MIVNRKFIKQQEEDFRQILQINALGDSKNKSRQETIDPNRGKLQVIANSFQNTIEENIHKSFNEIRDDKKSQTVKKPSPICGGQYILRIKPGSVQGTRRPFPPHYDNLMNEAIKTITIDFRGDESTRRNFRITNNQTISKRTSSAQSSANQWSDDQNLLLLVKCRKLTRPVDQINSKSRDEAQQIVRTDQRLSRLAHGLKYTDMCLQRIQTSPIKIREQGCQFYNQSYYFSFSKLVNLCAATTHNSYDPLDEIITINPKKMPRGILYQDIKILESGHRSFIGINNLFLLMTNFTHSKTKDLLQMTSQIRHFLSGFKKQAILGILANSKQKFNIGYSKDICDFVLQISSKSFDPPFAFQKQQACVGFNVQIVLDYLLNHGVIVNNLYILDSIELNGSSDLSSYQQRIPITTQPHEKVKIFHMFLSDRMRLPEMNRLELTRLQHIISKVITSNGNTVPACLTEFAIDKVLQKANNKGNYFIGQEEKYRQFENIKSQIKSNYRRISDSDYSSSFAAEKRAENFRDLMVDRIRQSGIKVSNMYFIVGDVVQRNIILFRNQENQSFFREKKHFDILTKLHEIEKESKQIISKSVEYNLDYFPIYIPEYQIRL